MVSFNISVCPNCRGKLKYYDSVPRVVRTRGRASVYIQIRRFRCSKCKKVHREIPDDIYPYKQYDAEIIRGVLDGFITSSTFGFEDYPCEMTMTRWKSKRKRLDIPGQTMLNFDVETSSEFVFTPKFHSPL